MPRKYQPEQKVSNEKLQPRQGEELERDIDAIEEEKEEYLRKHSEEKE